jgi:hypothetical protein
MQLWHGFIDEGYRDERAFCLGAVYAPQYVCDALGESLRTAILAVNERLAVGGSPPIDRYHATDCAGLHKKFSKKRGWDIDRQIKFTKRICEILIEENATASAFGGSFADLRPHLDPSEDEKKFWYLLCFKMLIHSLTAMLEVRYPDDRLVIYYDDSPKFGSLAKRAYQDFMESTATKARQKYLLDCKPTTWREKTELQLADYVTLQGLWRIDGSARGDNTVKKSLAALIGNMPISIERFSEQNFIDMMRMHENVQAGLPIGDGVDSKLMVLTP